MKKLALLMIPALALVGCKMKFACDIEESVVKVVASGTATALACKNQDAIEKQLKSWAEPLGLCDKDIQRMKGSGICNTLGDMVLSSVLRNGVPADWECSGGVAKDTLKLAIDAACSKI